jgi:F-type H+-transporting ATPase subunit gamma
MSGAKEIRSKIKSIQSTQKITSAMEMVAASKMRKAQQRMLASRPFTERIRNVIDHLSESHSEYHHPYLQPRDSKKIGLIVVASDRGLCGGLNSNIFRHLHAKIQTWTKDESKELNYCSIGVKAEQFVRSQKGNLLASTSRLGDTPAMADVIGPVGVMLKSFEDGEIDELYVAYNNFVNTMSQKPFFQKLLPVAPSVKDLKGDKKAYWDYIYEPDAKELLDFLLTRYIESQVYHSVVENFACEQAARMVAMKSASENAVDIIGNLQLVYNKARQASITQELSEIVGGAAAV